MAESGGIEGEGIERGDNLPFFLPAAAERIAVGTLKGEHPVLEHPLGVEVMGRGGGEIDIPLAVDVVELRCPDQLAHRTALRLAPDGHRLGFTQAFQRGGAANLQPIVFRHGGNKIVAVVMAQDKRVRALFNKGIRPVVHQAFLTCSLVFNSWSSFSSL